MRTCWLARAASRELRAPDRLPPPESFFRVELTAAAIVTRCPCSLERVLCLNEYAFYVVGHVMGLLVSKGNLFHQKRTVSWLMSIPRSNSRASTFRSDSGNRTYIMTTRRMISGEELKQRNGLAGWRGLGIGRNYPPKPALQSRFICSDSAGLFDALSISCSIN